MQSSRTLARAALALLLFASLLLAACGSTTERLAESRPTEASASSGASADAAPAATKAPAPTEAPTETPPTPEPPTATPEPLKDLTVIASGFGQRDKQVGFAVEVQNPNTGAALEGASLQIVAYAGDAIIGSDDSTLPFVPPDATIYFGGDMYLDTEDKADRIEVQLTDMGNAQEATAEQIPTFPVEGVSFKEGMFGQRVSGIISNPFTVPLENLYVGIAAYDEGGNIIGGGFTFLDFLLPEGKSPFATSVILNGTPARFEVSPILSNLTLWSQRDTEDMPPLTLVEQGWGRAENQIGFGVIVENPNTEQAMDGAQYSVGVYAEDGSVIAVEYGYFGLILPGSKAARANTIYLGSDDATPARVEVQILPGDLADAEGKLPFTTEGANYLPGQFGSKANGMLMNPYDEEADSVQINAILRDAAGTIIGGGSSFSDAIPANGKAVIEVTVAAGGEVATTELYGNEAAITSIGED